MSHIIIIIKNKKLINLDKSYSFTFIDRNDDIKIQHPVSNYYFKLSDISLNLLISLKWANWGYFFLKEVSKNIKTYENIEIFENNIENNILLNTSKKHILILDNKEILDDKNFIDEMEGIYNEEFVDTNTKIHFKLKINLKEYLILNYMLKPELMKLDENN